MTTSPSTSPTSLDSVFLKSRRTARAVERKASETLERCRRKRKLDSIPLPVPVEEWIEQALNFRFSVADLSDLGDGVLGAAYPTKREIFVSSYLVNQEARYRFTCAHELGHMILHRKVAQTFQDTSAADPMSAPPSNKIEWQANRFAAAFLMPADLLIPELFDICDRHALDRDRCIAELMMDTPESEWLWRYRFLPELTRRFGVSLSAMLHRFGDFRLPDSKPFLLPTHVERLLRRTEEGDVVRDFHLKGGFPIRQPRLFPVE